MHDDLCPCINKGDKRWCECDLIAKVRADERHRVVGIGYDMGEAETRDNLRAKVEALDWWIDDDSVADPLTTAVVYRDDVLTLLDRGQR